MKMRILLAASVAAIALAGPAHAGTGWYLGLGGGYDMPQNVSWDSPPFTQSGYIKLKDTGAYFLDGGYKWDNGFRIELEGQYAQPAGKEIALTSPFFFAGPLSGHISQSTVYMNANYDLPIADRWSLTVGGGVGVGWADVKGSAFGGAAVVKGTDAAFAYQADAGIAYALCPNLDLQLDYRYQGLGSTSVTEVGAGRFDLGNEKSQTVMLSLRWFVSEPPPPPPPAPPPPPPPPPPPVKTFIVFFDFNKSNLTAEAQSVVAEAAKTAKTTGMVKIVVTGHTDTVGSHSYNQALSERRAGAVKDGLVAEGIDGAGVSTLGKSFDDPLVATGPNVREPQNRRAVIQLGDGSGM